ncbi:MAG: hypothetical protein ACYS9X_03440 [Planctomycetota bacterium]|jgi:hypothetical protein
MARQRLTQELAERVAMAAEPRIEDAPVDEATRFAEPRAVKTCSRIVFALVMFNTLLVLYVFLGKVPLLSKAFLEMAMELPALTIFVLSVAPVAGPLVLVAAIGSAVKEFVVTNRNATLAINGVHLVVLVVARELLDLALAQPLLHLMESLG